MFVWRCSHHRNSLRINTEGGKHLSTVSRGRQDGKRPSCRWRRRRWLEAKEVVSLLPSDCFAKHWNTRKFSVPAKTFSSIRPGETRVMPVVLPITQSSTRPSPGSGRLLRSSRTCGWSRHLSVTSTSSRRIMSYATPRCWFGWFRSGCCHSARLSPNHGNSPIEIFSMRAATASVAVDAFVMKFTTMNTRCQSAMPRRRRQKANIRPPVSASSSSFTQCEAKGSTDAKFLSCTASSSCSNIGHQHNSADWHVPFAFGFRYRDRYR